MVFFSECWHHFGHHFHKNDTQRRAQGERTKSAGTVMDRPIFEEVFRDEILFAFSLTLSVIHLQYFVLLAIWIILSLLSPNTSFSSHLSNPSSLLSHYSIGISQILFLSNKYSLQSHLVFKLSKDNTKSLIVSSSYIITCLFDLS